MIRRLLLIALFSLMFAVAATAPASAQGYETVVVASGDTISKIAQRYCVDWQDLYNINRKIIGPDPNVIEVGMALTVPNLCSAGGQGAVYDHGPRSFATGRVQGNVYTVAWGDTLDAISVRFGVPKQTLVQSDGLETENVQLGQQIVIPGLAVPPQEEDDTLTPQSLLGSYRFQGSPEDGVDYYLVLEENGVATISEQPHGASEASDVAAGVWSADGETVTVELDAEQGQPLDTPRIMRFTFIDGFPVVSDVKVDDSFLHLDEAVFTLGSGESSPLVAELHRRLAAVPGLNFQDPGPDNAVYTEATRQAVVEFQNTQGLTPNGVVDARTWVLLETAATGQPAAVASAPAPAEQPAPAQAAAAPPAAPPDISALPTQAEDGSPIVYLTFDDGPQPGSTQPILDILAQYGANATFFMVGKNAAAFPDLVRSVVSSGHYAADHTWDHTSLKDMSKEEFINEVERTRQAILDAASDLMTLDGTVRYVRPPYGATDDNTRQYAADLGFTIVLWTIDPQDWRRPGADVIVQHVLSHVYPGAIVLMHDGGGDRSQTIEALQTILPNLQQQGYQVRTIFLP